MTRQAVPAPINRELVMMRWAAHFGLKKSGSFAMLAAFRRAPSGAGEFALIGIGPLLVGPDPLRAASVKS